MHVNMPFGRWLLLVWLCWVFRVYLIGCVLFIGLLLVVCSIGWFICFVVCCVWCYLWSCLIALDLWYVYVVLLCGFDLRTGWFAVGCYVLRWFGWCLVLLGFGFGVYVYCVVPLWCLGFVEFDFYYLVAWFSWVFLVILFDGVLW